MLNESEECYLILCPWLLCVHVCGCAVHECVHPCMWMHLSISAYVVDIDQHWLSLYYSMP